MKESSSSKTIQDQIKGDIDNTIDALEARIRNTKHTAKKTVHKAQPPPSYNYDGYAKKMRIVWTLVGSITIAILGMWGWNMRTVFYDVSRGAYTVATPLDTAGSTFDEAMKIAGNNDQQAADAGFGAAGTAIKQALGSITSSTPAQETSPSSTPLDALAAGLSTHTTSTTSTMTTTTP